MVSKTKTKQAETRSCPKHEQEQMTTTGLYAWDRAGAGTLLPILRCGACHDEAVQSWLPGPTGPATQAAPWAQQQQGATGGTVQQPVVVRAPDGSGTAGPAAPSFD